MLPYTPYKWNKRRYILSGLLLVVVGIAMGVEGVDAFRTGKRIWVLHGVAKEGWEQIAIAGFIIFLGLCLIACGLGWMKPRS